VLDDVDSEIFAIFNDFLHRGENTVNYASLTAEESEQCDAQGWSRLVALWTLGERLLSTSFKDFITDLMIDKVNRDRWERPIPTDLHEKLYPKSSSISGVRKLLVDIACWEWESETFEACKVRKHSDASWEFMVAVAVAPKERAEEAPWMRHPFEEGPGCRYHEHIKGLKECYHYMV
jgi:hypothetical protein